MTLSCVQYNSDRKSSGPLQLGLRPRRHQLSCCRQAGEAARCSRPELQEYAPSRCKTNTYHMEDRYTGTHHSRANSHREPDKQIREIDKIGYTRVVSEQNRVPFFSRRGALTHVCKTPPKRVLAPEPTTPCVRAAPQTVFSVFDPSKQRQ